MGEFRLNEQQLKDQLTNLSNTKGSLILIRASVDANILRLRLTNNSATANAVRTRLGAVGKRLGKEINNINKIKNTGNQICSYARNAEIKAERSLMGVPEILIPPRFNASRYLVTKVILAKSVGPVFAELIVIGYVIGNLANNYKHGTTQAGYNPSYGDPAKGQYGGNQSGPVEDEEHFNDYAAIVRKYYPDMTDDEVKAYLTKMESEGCGYVALVNTIFAQYVGREDEFEKTFGFPMYDENGRPNSNRLLTDFYSATDNHNKGKKGKDVVDVNEDPSNIEGTGTNRDSREYRWEKYTSEHGIKSDVHNLDKVTKDNYSKLAKNGEIIVGINPVKLRDATGKVVYNSDGGHAMTVTGVTEDGLLRVSSWGEEYYIDPNDTDYNKGHITFQQVTYK